MEDGGVDDVLGADFEVGPHVALEAEGGIRSREEVGPIAAMWVVADGTVPVPDRQVNTRQLRLVLNLAVTLEAGCLQLRLEQRRLG